MIEDSGKPKIFWNYFLALEDDLCTISRYIEFNKDNDGTYSIELVRLLLASSSEVDVVLKELCKLLDENFNSENSDINDYKVVIKSKIQEFTKEKVYLKRYERILSPWQNWDSECNPDWWRGYNNVKHHRTQHFDDAKLNYVLNSMAGLLVSVFYYYKLLFSQETKPKNNDEVIRQLKPNSNLLFLDEKYYPNYLIV